MVIKMSRKRIGVFKKVCGGVMLAAALVVASPIASLHSHADKSVEDAQDVAAQNSAFEIDADILLSDKDTYNIQLNIKNNGADWEGMVRVFAQGDVLTSGRYSGRVPNVYDTSLSLPQNSEKQFVVKIPKGASDYEGSNIRVALLDKKSKVVAEKLFSRLLLDEMESISMGILSDEYAELTYLDMGGITMYYYNTDMPVKLMDMTKNNLTDALDSLAILVIDEYNTEILTDEEIQAIALWIDNGGVLIVGTGAAAKETLSGLEDVIPDVECLNVSKPGTGAATSSNEYDSLDRTKLSIANLQAKSNQYGESYFSNGLVTSVGDGAMGIVPFSLTELGQKADVAIIDFPQEQYVLNLLEEFTGMSNSRFNRSQNVLNDRESLGQVQRLMGILGNADSTLNFGFLKFLVVVYVIFAGPILYLILRAAKKREWYWVAVPATAVLGIFMVFLAGRGFEVVNTRMYSVTTQDLSGKQGTKSYLYGYDAKFKEWSLQMTDGYDYAGCLNMDNYNYKDNIEATDFYYRVQNEGGRLTIGMKPTSAFEDSFFYAGKAKSEETVLGTLEFSGIAYDWSGIGGVITNNTNKDLEYFAVIINDSVRVYKDLPAGGQCSLDKISPVYTSSAGFSLRGEYIYDFLREIHQGDIKEDKALTAALGVGIRDAYPQSDYDRVVICGVVKNWDKTIDDDCNETAYGCVYTIY